MSINPVNRTYINHVTYNTDKSTLQNKISYYHQINTPNSDSLSFKSRYITAKSLREAEAYARNKLNIKNYNVSNLDVANYINKGLSYLNSVTNGKIGALDGVVYTDFSKCGTHSYAIASLQTERQISLKNIFNLSKLDLKHTLLINKYFFNNIDVFVNRIKLKLLQTSLLKNDKNGLKLNDNFTTKDQQKYEKLMNTRLKHLSLEEKVDLCSYLFTLQNYAMFKQSIVDTSIKKILKDKNKSKK